MRDTFSEDVLAKLAVIMDTPDDLINKGEKKFSNGNGRMDSTYQVTEWVKYDDDSKTSGTKIRVMYPPHCTNMYVSFRQFKVTKFKNPTSIFSRPTVIIDLNEDSAGIHDISSKLHCYTLRADRMFHEQYLKAQENAYQQSLRKTEEKLAKAL